MDSKKEEVQVEITLELPDYSSMYYEWKKKQEEQKTEEETVVVIDIY